MNNKIAMGGVVLVLIGASFYGGMVYGKNQAAGAVQSRRGNFQAGDFAGGNFQGRNGGGAGNMMRGGGGNVSGEILSKSDTSFTVKMRDGGSKIVIYSAATPVREFTEVKQDQLVVGKTVTVNGTANSDGSVTAQIIQIRDASSTIPFGGPNRPPQQ